MVRTQTSKISGLGEVHKLTFKKLNVSLFSKSSNSMGDLLTCPLDIYLNGHIMITGDTFFFIRLIQKRKPVVHRRKHKRRVLKQDQ